MLKINNKKHYADIYVYKPSYKVLHEQFVEKTGSKITKEEFENIIVKYFDFVKEKLVEGKLVFLKERIGEVQIIGIKPDVPPTNFNYKNKNSKMKFQNFNTGGYVYRLIYRAKNYMNSSFRYFEMYRNIATNTTRRLIKASIEQEKHLDWIKLTKKEYINPFPYRKMREDASNYNLTNEE